MRSISSRWLCPLTQADVKNLQDKFSGDVSSLQAAKSALAEQLSKQQADVASSQAVKATQLKNMVEVRVRERWQTALSVW